MGEMHIVRCDAPGCTTQEALRMTTVTAQYGTAYTFSLPSSGWQRIEGRLLCSWACVAAYAEQRAKEQ